MCLQSCFGKKAFKRSFIKHKFIMLIMNFRKNRGLKFIMLALYIINNNEIYIIYVIIIHEANYHNVSISLSLSLYIYIHLTIYLSMLYSILSPHLHSNSLQPGYARPFGFASLGKNIYYMYFFASSVFFSVVGVFIS